MGCSQAPPRIASRRIEIKTAVFLIVMVTTGPLGAVFLREGMKRAQPLIRWNPAIVIQLCGIMLTNQDVWLGIGSRVVAALAFMCLLSWADYSFVNPASSVSYVIAVCLGWLMLGEAVPTGRWIGAILICLGVAFIGKTPPRTTPVAEENRGKSV